MAEKILLETTFPLVEGRFLRKINRFVLELAVKGKATRVYIPNPGRLSTILTLDRRMLLKEKASGKYRYEVFAAKMNGFYATLDPKLANELFASAVRKRLLPGFTNCFVSEREVKTRAGRLDFRLSCAGRKRLVEVKSCTHVERGVAKFPDRRTERGRRHLKYLMGLENACLVIVVQRPDARAFAPYREIDLEFADLFEKAVRKKSVDVYVFSTRFKPPKILLEKTSVPVLLRGKGE